MIDKVTSFEIKLALLQYYRLKRQWICVDEFSQADIIADTGKEIIEVEVKISTADLCREKKKLSKHQCYRRGLQWDGCHPNKYLFCVPGAMVEAAQKMVAELNPKYGIISFNANEYLHHISRGYLADYLFTVKRASKLHGLYDKRQRERIAKRCSVKLLGLMEKQHLENINGREMPETSPIQG